MQLEEYVKSLEAAGYHISIHNDVVHQEVEILVTLANGQIKSCISIGPLYTLDPDTINMIIFNRINTAVYPKGRERDFDS